MQAFHRPADKWPPTERDGNPGAASAATRSGGASALRHAGAAHVAAHGSVGIVGDTVSDVSSRQGSESDRDT